MAAWPPSRAASDLGAAVATLAGDGAAHVAPGVHPVALDAEEARELARVVLATSGASGDAEVHVSSYPGASASGRGWVWLRVRGSLASPRGRESREGLAADLTSRRSLLSAAGGLPFFDPARERSGYLIECWLPRARH